MSLYKFVYNEDGVAQFYTGCDHPLIEAASPDELRAAVLPLIDYEAAAKEANRLLKIAFPWPWEGNGVPRFAKDIVDAALGLKEKE